MVKYKVCDVIGTLQSNKISMFRRIKAGDPNLAGISHTGACAQLLMPYSVSLSKSFELYYTTERALKQPDRLNITINYTIDNIFSCRYCL